MTIDTIENFDNGDENGTGWNTGGAGGKPAGEPFHFNNQQTTGSITWPLTGRRGACARMVGNGVAACGFSMSFPLSTHRVFAFYFRAYANPSAQSKIFQGVRAGFVNNTCNVYVNTDGTIQMECQGTSQIGPNVVDGNWHRLDMHIDTTNTTYTIDWMVDGVAQTQVSDAGNTAGWTTRHGSFGGPIANTLTQEIDDFLSSPDAADYPINGGEDYFISTILPEADGTHNAGTNVMEDQAGTDIGVVEAWRLLNEWNPWVSANHVRQRAAGASNYVEVRFADVVETNILGATLLVTGGSEQAASPDLGVKVYDSTDTLHLDWYTGEIVSGSTASLSGSLVIPAPAGGWTREFLNGLKVRFGYSTNASGTVTPRIYDMCIQYAWSAPAPESRQDWSKFPQALVSH